MPPRRTKQSEESIEAEVRGDNAANIAGVYDAPFSIYSEAEGLRYRELRSKSIEVPTWFDFDLLEQIGLKDQLMTLCDRGSWQNFVLTSLPVYRDLTLEFFTSLKFATRPPKKLWFRLRGRLFYLDETLLRHVCGFLLSDIEDGHHGFSVTAYWKQLTDLDAYDPHIASNAEIVQAEFKLLHKFICGSVFGKRQSTKCSTKELFLLWCIEHGHKPNMFNYVARTLIELQGRQGSSLGMGYIATAIARSGSIDLSDLEMLNYHYFDVPYLTRCDIIVDQTSRLLRDPGTRRALKRRWGAGESSSEGHSVEYGSETAGRQPQAQHPRGLHEWDQHQQWQPDLGTIHQLMLANQRRTENLILQHQRTTQEQLNAIQEQMQRINAQLLDLNARHYSVDEELEYMMNKWDKAWKAQGLQVPSPTTSGSGSSTPDGTDAATASRL